MAISFIRTVIVFAILFASMRIMGKRQLGELEPIELTVAILISNLASQPLADIGTPLLYGLIPVLTLLSIQVIISWVSVKSIVIRRVLGGRPAILIEKGSINQSELRRNRISLDELFVELRRCGITEVREVKRAVLETDGSLSVMPYDRFSPVTPDDMGIEVSEKGLPIALISDGRVLSSNLKILALDKKWLVSQLRKRGIKSPKEVFLLTADEKKEIYLVKREAKK